ncbi:MAG: TrmH family RNA methyltransferase [Actinomycetota bacterium]
MGATFLLPWALLEPWPDGLDIVRSAGFRLIVLTPKVEAGSISDVRQGPPTALILGSEAQGLSARAMAQADLQVRTPLEIDADSLVGHAAAIAFHHFRFPRTQ